jgi:hypothetical protein
MIVDREADMADNQLILQTDSICPDCASDGCAVQVTRHQQEATVCSVGRL